MSGISLTALVVVQRPECHLDLWLRIRRLIRYNNIHMRGGAIHMRKVLSTSLPKEHSFYCRTKWTLYVYTRTEYSSSAHRLKRQSVSEDRPRRSFQFEKKLWKQIRLERQMPECYKKRSRKACTYCMFPFGSISQGHCGCFLMWFSLFIQHLLDNIGADF